MFAGSMVANICGFLFNLLLARRLSTIDYGVYGSLVALFSIITIPPQSLSTTLVKFSSEYFLENNIGKGASLFKESFKFLAIIGFIITGILIVLSQILLQFLHISNIFLIIFIAIVIGLYFVSIVPMSFLQGRLQFGLAAIMIALGGLAKIMGGFLFLILGFSVFGALGGVSLSFIIPCIIGAIPLLYLFSSHKKSQISLKGILSYAFPTSVAMISLTMLISVDLILVKHFFTPHQAGLYAGITFVGKSIFYFTGSIPLVMFPLLIKRHKKNENIHKLFILAILLVIIPSFFAIACFILFPHIVITIFLGGKQYGEIANYLGIYGLFITAFSVLNLLVNFFVSLQKTKISYIILLGTFFQTILIVIFHSSFYQIIGISLFLSLLLIVILLLYYVKLYVKKTISFTHYSRL